MNDIKHYKLKLRLIFIESILTFGAMGFCMPIMTVFWNSIGMDQKLIGLSQMICTLAMLIFDIPMGYMADRFNRKKMNLLGDFGIVITFIIYMSAHNFVTVLVAETLCGIFIAMTNGVDNAFLKFYSDKIDESGELFRKNNAKLSIYQGLSFAFAIIIGMFISKYSIRATIGAVAIPFIIGTILSLFIDDIGAKIESTEKGVIRKFIANIKHILKDEETRWLVFVWSIADNITHAIIWVLTPLLILVGVPVYIVGIGWLLNYITPVIGAIIARKIMNIRFSHKVALPFILVAIGTLPIIINANIFTVWLFALTGIASGFKKTFFMPAIQERVEDNYQTTIVSVVSTVARIVYLPAVYLINYFGDVNPQNALTANLIIFIPLAFIIYLHYNKRSVK